MGTLAREELLRLLRTYITEDPHCLGLTVEQLVLHLEGQPDLADVVPIERARDARRDGAPTDAA